MYVCKREREHTKLLSPVCHRHHGSLAVFSRALCWIRRQTAILKPNTARHLQKPGAGGREKMTEDTEIDGWKVEEKCGSDARIGTRPGQTAWVTVWLRWGHLLRVYTSSQPHAHKHTLTDSSCRHLQVVSYPPSPNPTHRPKDVACESTPCWGTKGRNRRSQNNRLKKMSYDNRNCN